MESLGGWCWNNDWRLWQSDSDIDIDIEGLGGDVEIMIEDCDRLAVTIISQWRQSVHLYGCPETLQGGGLEYIMPLKDVNPDDQKYNTLSLDPWEGNLRRSDIFRRFVPSASLHLQSFSLIYWKPESSVPVKSNTRSPEDFANKTQRRNLWVFSMNKDLIEIIYKKIQKKQ